MLDTYRHKGLRKKLVEEIRSKGISDERVLRAIDQIPRHFFMDSGFINFAYKDQAFPIGCGQTISQPYTVAFQTQLLDVKKHDKVLEVGTGSGYQSAILVELGVKLYTIERQRDLFLKAQEILGKMGYKPMFFFGDGYEGQPSYGPYDRILITAGAPEIPQKLVDQLKTGGVLVAPIGGSGSQIMTRLVKLSENEVEVTEHGHFVFVPLLKGKAYS
jgi:protein-L-isoaspartate(D-aspartate) O-methyltransferase